MSRKKIKHIFAEMRVFCDFQIGIPLCCSSQKTHKKFSKLTMQQLQDTQINLCTTTTKADVRKRGRLEHSFKNTSHVVLNMKDLRIKHFQTTQLSQSLGGDNYCLTSVWWRTRPWLSMKDNSLISLHSLWVSQAEMLPTQQTSEEKRKLAMTG